MCFRLTTKSMTFDDLKLLYKFQFSRNFARFHRFGTTVKRIKLDIDPLMSATAGKPSRYVANQL